MTFKKITIFLVFLVSFSAASNLSSAPLHPRDEMYIGWVTQVFLSADERRDMEALKYLLDPAVTGQKNITQQKQKEVLKKLTDSGFTIKRACHIGMIGDLRDAALVRMKPRNEQDSASDVILYVIKRDGVWFVAFAEPTNLRGMFLKRLLKD